LLRGVAIFLVGGGSGGSKRAITVRQAGDSASLFAIMHWNVRSRSGIVCPQILIVLACGLVVGRLCTRHGGGAHRE
jgi:hypothetical protein